MFGRSERTGQLASWYRTGSQRTSPLVSEQTFLLLLPMRFVCLFDDDVAASRCRWRFVCLFDDDDNVCLFFIVLQTEPKASNILGRCAIPELHTQVLGGFVGLFVVCFEAKYDVAQTGLNPLILVPPLPKCRGNWCVPPQPQ